MLVRSLSFVAAFWASVRKSTRLLLLAACALEAVAVSSACCFSLCAAAWRAVTYAEKVFPTFATAAWMVGSE